MMLLKLIAASSPEFRHSVISLKETGTIGQRLQKFGISVEALHFGRFGAAKGYFRLTRMISQQNPDVIQGWMYHANFAASLAAIQLRRRGSLSWSIRCSLDDSPSRKLLTRAMIRVGVWLSALPRTIIYNSERSQHQHETLGFKRNGSLVIANGFNIDEFYRSPGKRELMRGQWGVSENQIVVGTVGRASSLKDHATFLRAALALVSENSQVVVLIAGREVPTSYMRNTELRALITSLGKNVILLDEQSDVPKIMNGLDIFVLSSVAEGFPNVLGEAMACELPCVVTDVGDCRLVSGDTGTVVPAKNPSALAGAIIELVASGQDHRAELGARARARIVADFSMPASLEKYEAEWRRVYRQERFRKDGEGGI